jgi:hypothetical protein
MKKTGSKEVAELYSSMREEIERLVVENEALRADAERYRWVKENDVEAANLFNSTSGDFYDHYIDAARAARGAG